MSLEIWTLQLVAWEIIFFVSLGLCAHMVRLAYRVYKKDPDTLILQKY